MTTRRARQLKSFTLQYQRSALLLSLVLGKLVLFLDPSEMLNLEPLKNNIFTSTRRTIFSHLHVLCGCWGEFPQIHQQVCLVSWLLVVLLHISMVFIIGMDIKDRCGTRNGARLKYIFIGMLVERDNLAFKTKL